MALNRNSDATRYREVGMELMSKGKIVVLANMPAQEIIELIHRHNAHMRVTATDCIMDGKKCYTIRVLKQ